jgi:hypothetical protein
LRESWKGRALPAWASFRNTKPGKTRIANRWRHRQATEARRSGGGAG